MFPTNLFPKIVGSSRGLGRELAFKLAALDATVICIDLQKADQEMTSKTVVDLGGSAFYYQCDVTSKEQVEKTMSEIMSEIGKVTMLYTCCSLPSPRSVVTNPPSVRQTIDTSVTSYFYVSVASVFLSGFGLSSCAAYQQKTSQAKPRHYRSLTDKNLVNHRLICSLVT